jgi:hypothetical protein
MKKPKSTPKAPVQNLEEVVVSLNTVIQRKAKVDQAVDEVGQDGNWDWDPYMLGLYNGLVYAQALLDNKEPIYRDRPETGFKCNDATISKQLEEAVRTDILVEAEKKSEGFAKKIMGGF